MMYSDSIQDVYTEHINKFFLVNEHINNFCLVNHFLNNNLNYWVIGLVCYEKRPAVPQKGERPIKRFNRKLKLRINLELSSALG